MPIPTMRELAGLEVYFQAFAINAAQTALTNFVEVVIQP